MVSGVDLPAAQNPLIEASGSVSLVNQARQGAIINSSQLVVGKQFQAEVVSSLADGTYIVKVADVAARMQLPNSPQVGAKIPLTLISTSPRATFLLSSSDLHEGALAGGLTTTTATLGTTKQLMDDFVQSSGAKSTLSTELNLPSGPNVSAVEDTHPDPLDPQLTKLTATLPDSTPTTFSSAGKLVDQLIQSATPQSAIAVSKVPLLATPDVNMTASDIAKVLQSSVSSSGVFYESHLLQWAEGTLPVAELMKEPQANFPLPPKELTNINNIAVANAAVANSNPNTPVSANNATGSTNPAMTAPLPVILSQEATQLVQQQLQTMEQQRFIWRGELWPGQPMEWEISRDPPQQQGRQPEQTWQSAVHFELPQLGTVSAQLKLTGTHLKLIVHTKDAPTARVLQNHANELTGALEGGGAQLDSLLIKTKPST